MQAGDYVRFYDRSWTEIGQIVGEVEDSHLKVVKCRDGYYDLDNFIKSSPSIIDLIEVGDICTFEVVDIDNYEDYIGKHTEVINQDELEDFKDMIQNESAKLISIVTKEQFESMEYKVEE